MDHLVIVIIDDERDKRETIHMLINRLFPKNRFEFYLCDSVKSATDSIKRNLPDLVFLDIEMPDANGFELFNEVNKDSFEVVFTTAFSEYMDVSVNEVGCFGYLLKPVSLDKLKRIFDRFFQKNIETKYLKFVHVAQNRRVLLDLKEIIYCKADNNYCEIFTKNNKYVLSKTLKEVEERLPKNIFVRTHRSYLVNLNQVFSYQKDKSCLFMNSQDIKFGQEIPVSISHKDKIEALFL